LKEARRGSPVATGYGAAIDIPERGLYFFWRSATRLP
jgi:hypothetical protein